jgi:hypothetical protein
VSKIAVFVEGQTEAIFTQALLQAIAGASRIRIDRVSASGKRKRRIIEVLGSAVDTQQPFYALIHDSGQDEHIVSDIASAYERLRASGYTMILGLRDVYPIGSGEVQRLRDGMRQGLRHRLKNDPDDVHLLLAVMEVEAWFIGEHTHFQRLDARLTCEHILANMNFDPSQVNIEGIAHPANDLRRIYALAERPYEKTRAHVEATVAALDFAHLCVTVKARAPGLAALVERIGEFVAQD